MEESAENITFVITLHYMAMKIGIEAQRIFRRNKHGMDYVALEEARALQQIDKHNSYYVFVKPGPDRCLHESPNMHIVEVACPSYPLWEQWALPRAAKKWGVDMLHCTSNTAPVGCRLPLVITLHDIIFLEPRPQKNKSLYQNLGRLYRRYVVPRVTGNAKRIITVSEYERLNIKERLGIGEPVLTMIYNGYNQWFKPIADSWQTARKYVAQEGYFFFLGNTDPKKNTERTLLAYSLYLKTSKMKRRLLVADLPKSDILRLLRSLGVSEAAPYIEAPGYIPNSDLPYIYNSAFAYLYTSLRESFGIPLLEAMACGVPVITSRTSSMPEIGGDGALYVDPTEPDDIAAMMLRLETQPDMRRAIVEQGSKRAALFSWQRAARQLVEVYESVAAEIGIRP